jgi:hypothetical protein
VEEIAEASRAVDKEANAASKAEIRGLSVMVHTLTSKDSAILVLVFRYTYPVFSDAEATNPTYIKHLGSSCQPSSMGSERAARTDPITENNSQFTQQFRLLRVQSRHEKSTTYCRSDEHQ